MLRTAGSEGSALACAFSVHSYDLVRNAFMD